MTDQQAITDRAEIVALQSEYTDAAMMRDADRLLTLYTEDAIYRIPDAGIELVGWEAIRAGHEELAGNWEFFVQNTHSGSIRIDGDTATGRAFIFELGRQRDGRCMQNYALFHDHYRRTADGWKFTARVYEVRYFDPTPLAGSPEVVLDGYEPGQNATTAERTSPSDQRFEESAQ